MVPFESPTGISREEYASWGEMRFSEPGCSSGGETFITRGGTEDLLGFGIGVLKVTGGQLKLLSQSVQQARCASLRIDRGIT